MTSQDNDLASIPSQEDIWEKLGLLSHLSNKTQPYSAWNKGEIYLE